MAGNQTDRNVVCLLCLELTQLKSHSSSNPCQSITSKFANFCTTFLQAGVSGEEQLWKGFKCKTEPWWRWLYFCKDCEVLVENVLKLHSELNVITAKLLWKINEIRKVISQSSGGSSRSSGGVLKRKGNTLEHLKRIRDGVDVEEFRKDFVNKCAEKTSSIFPVVILYKDVNNSENGKVVEVLKGNNLIVPTKSDLNFMISIIIVLALRRKASFNLQQIVEHQTLTLHSKSNSSIERSLSQMKRKPEYYDKDAGRHKAEETKGWKRARKVKTGKAFLKSARLSAVKEVSNVSDDNPEAGEEPYTEPFNDEDMDRNSDISMSFSEWNIKKETDEIKPDLPLPNPTKEVDEQLREVSATDATVTIKRRPPQRSLRWECDVCNRCFRVRKELEFHKRKLGHSHYRPHSRHKGNPVSQTQMKCDFCPKEFRNSHLLLDHLAQDHDGGPDKWQVTCKTCQSATKTTKELSKHLRKVHENTEEKFHFCPFCPESYTTSQMLELHRKSFHRRSPPLFCDDDDCSQSFFFVEDLNSHMRQDPSHQHREMFHCDICRRAFFSNAHCHIHQLNHIRADKQLKFACPGVACSRRFRLKSDLLNHYNTTHFSLCDRLCFLSCLNGHIFLTFSRSELDFHLKSHGSDSEYKYHCAVCDLKFPTYNKKKFHSATKDHLQRAAEADEREMASAKIEPLLLNCDICEETFSSRARRRLHRKTAHAHLLKQRYIKSHKAALVCEVCAKSFCNMSALQKHMSGHNEPQFQCPHCEKSYRWESYMQIHINRTHVKSNIYVCEICGRNCATLSEYKSHRKEHELLHSCHVCPKKFSRAGTLRSHMRMHTGEKLECQWCSALYSALGNMKSHVKDSHPEQYQYYYGTGALRTSLRFKIVKPADGEDADSATKSMEMEETNSS